jgi:hypothetical protein
MKLHERTQKVSIASAELGVVILDFQKEHGLTDIELLQALNSTQDTVLKYMLRFERHSNYEKGAGEA